MGYVLVIISDHAECPFVQFLILPAISEDISNNIVNWTNEIKNLPHRSDAWMHYEEIDAKGQRTLCRTENFANYHDGFNRLFRGDEIWGILEQLNGEKMVLFKEKINYKVCFKHNVIRFHLNISTC
ncbi:hypothetical protein MPER_08557 [Moniliophthora perniciosa FA553]|nr:hypothetical protein MPER_08557 [Moniliophthora perniciosa FA553]